MGRVTGPSPERLVTPSLQTSKSISAVCPHSDMEHHDLEGCYPKTNRGRLTEDVLHFRSYGEAAICAGETAVSGFPASESNPSTMLCN